MTTRYFLIRTDANLDQAGLTNERGMVISQNGSSTVVEAAAAGKCSKKSDGYGGETDELSESAFYAGKSFTKTDIVFVHVTNGKPVRTPHVLVAGEKPLNGKKYSSWTQLDYDTALVDYRPCTQDGVSYYKYSATED